MVLLNKSEYLLNFTAHQVKCNSFRDEDVVLSDRTDKNYPLSISSSSSPLPLSCQRTSVVMKTILFSLVFKCFLLTYSTIFFINLSCLTQLFMIIYTYCSKVFLWKDCKIEIIIKKLPTYFQKVRIKIMFSSFPATAWYGSEALIFETLFLRSVVQFGIKTLKPQDIRTYFNSPLFI